MTSTDTVSTIFGRCPDCGSAYVAERRLDGSIRPAEGTDGCECVGAPLAKAPA